MVLKSFKSLEPFSLKTSLDFLELVNFIKLKPIQKCMKVLILREQGLILRSQKGLIRSDFEFLGKKTWAPCIRP